jgi:uncharacterized protein DUF4349
MKATTLSLITVLALTACGRDSSSTGGGSAGGAEKVEFTAQNRGMPTVAPQPGMARDAAGQSEADFSASAPQAVATGGTSGDPLQNLNALTAAPTIMIRTGQAFVEVEKVDAAIFKIRQLTATVGGYITNTSVSGGRDQIRQATLELKIPAANYDKAVESLPTIGKVETVTSTAQDVGEEFVDVTARVNNARRLEERLVSLLANRTGKLDDVLRVERELARVREEIERYQGRLRYLTSRAAMSTLTITVHEPSSLLGSGPGENPIVAALRRAWRNFVALLAGIIASLGVVIPLALIGVGGWYAYRRWKKRGDGV